MYFACFQHKGARKFPGARFFIKIHFRFGYSKDRTAPPCYQSYPSLQTMGHQASSAPWLIARINKILTDFQTG